MRGLQADTNELDDDALVWERLLALGLADLDPDLSDIALTPFGKRYPTD